MFIPPQRKRSERERKGKKKKPCGSLWKELKWVPEAASAGIETSTDGDGNPGKEESQKETWGQKSNRLGKEDVPGRCQRRWVRAGTRGMYWDMSWSPPSPLPCSRGCGTGMRVPGSAGCPEGNSINSPPCLALASHPTHLFAQGFATSEEELKI